MPDAFGTAQQKLNIVWDLVQDFYKENNVKTRLGRLEMSMFVDKDGPHAHYPVLACKGKESEYITRAVAWIWTQYADEGNPTHVSISQVMNSLCALFDVCQDTGHQLTEAAKTQAMRHTDNLLLHYTALGNEAAAQGRWRWNLVPKFHMTWHWSRQVQFLHPRDTGCYIDEDFVGIVKGIAVACTGGMAIARLPLTIMIKYTQGMLMRWHRHATWGEAV
jgi:hypothetical protein